MLTPSTENGAIALASSGGRYICLTTWPVTFQTAGADCQPAESPAGW
jgi:hypothetical protein